MSDPQQNTGRSGMVQVRGELVTIVGPTPADWSGLGSTYRTDAVLVTYPDGETGSVPQAWLRDVISGEPIA